MGGPLLHLKYVCVQTIDFKRGRLLIAINNSKLMSQLFVLLSKAASQLLFELLAKLSTQLKVNGTKITNLTTDSSTRCKLRERPALMPNTYVY